MSHVEGKIAGVRRSLDLLEHRVMEFKAWCDQASRQRPPQQQASEISAGEVETVEQLVRDLSREIMGSEDTNPIVWEPSSLFCQKIERNCGEYWTQQAEYFRCFLLWINKTRAYLEYLEGQALHETSGGERPPGDNAPLALVMKGGGVKGLAYVGALEVLARQYEFNWFVGTSAGAITAILLGAGYTCGELTEILKQKDFGEFFDAKWYQLPINLWFHKGLYRADSFTKWIDTLLATKLRSPVRVRLSKLPKNKRVTIYASRRGKKVLTFDSLHSDDDAAYAVRCSMSIPLVFVPQSHQGLRTYDGGITCNYPVDQLLEDHPKTKFIGLYLGAEIFEGIERTSVLADIVSILMESSEPDNIEKYHASTVIIDTRPINTLDFSLTDEEKEFLLQAGRTAALAHLDDESDEYVAAVRKRDDLKKSVEAARRAAASKRRRRRRWALLALLIPIAGVATWRLWPQDAPAQINPGTGPNAGHPPTRGEEISSIGSKPSPPPDTPWPSETIRREYKTLSGQTVVEKNLGASTYTFTERVDNKSKILIVAPRGTVEFSTPPNTKPFDEGSKVDNGSLVIIVANSVTFRAKVNSRVFVILTTDGQRTRGLTFGDNIGEETRAYWSTDGGDPGTFQPPKNRPGNLEKLSLDEMLNLIQQHGVSNNLLSERDLQYLKGYLTERPK